MGGEEPVRLPRRDEAGRWGVGGVLRGLVQVRARGWGVPSRGHEIERVGVAASVSIRRGRRRGRRRGGCEEVEGRHARQPGMRLREEGGGVTAPVHRAPGRGRRRSPKWHRPFRGLSMTHSRLPVSHLFAALGKNCAVSGSALTSTTILLDYLLVHLTSRGRRQPTRPPRRFPPSPRASRPQLPRLPILYRAETRACTSAPYPAARNPRATLSQPSPL